MAELLLKRKKGGDLPPAEVLEMPVVPTLVFRTGNETNPFLFDLTSFATGLTAEEIAQRTTSNGRREKPYGARPQLIQELLPHIRNNFYFAASASCGSLVDALKWWWRFLDSCHDIAPVQSVADLDTIHYATYRVNPCGRRLATLFFALVGHAREAQNLPPLHWTCIEKPTQQSDLLAHEDVARLYTFFQQRCKSLLIRYENDDTIVPSWIDLRQLFTLFIILTGWNSQVALDIDVNEKNPDGTLACIMQDVQNPLYSIISSIKNRAGGTVQEAHGLNKQGISCVNIIRSLYRQTAPLRARVEAELAGLEERYEQIHKREVHVAQAEADALMMKIADLKAKKRSPWLYLGKENRIGMLDQGKLANGADGSEIAVAAAHINARLPAGAKPVAANIKLTDLRDAFISFRWHKGGYSWLATMMAAGHKSLASLNAYLNKKQHHQQSRASFLNVCNVTWLTIAELPSQAVKAMPTVIAARAQGVSEDQVRRWLAGQDLTIQGVGCQDHKNPPKSIAPFHKPGSGCRPQRCLLCPTHAVLLPDSYIYIAKRLAELRHIQSTMSMLAWVESDYVEEIENAISALGLYDDLTVTRELVYWEQEIKAGRHIPMRLEGEYV